MLGSRTGADWTCEDRAMPSRLRICFEDGSPEKLLETHVCGLALRSAGCKLNQAAHAHDLCTLRAFFAPADDPAAWFPLDELRHTLRNLIALLETQPPKLCNATASLQDLRALEQLLAPVVSSRFRLSFATVAVAPDLSEENP